MSFCVKNSDNDKVFRGGETIRQDGTNVVCHLSFTALSTLSHDGHASTVVELVLNGVLEGRRQR